MAFKGDLGIFVNDNSDAGSRDNHASTNGSVKSTEIARFRSAIVETTIDIVSFIPPAIAVAALLPTTLLMTTSGGGESDEQKKIKEAQKAATQARVKSDIAAAKTAKELRALAKIGKLGKGGQPRNKKGR